jgi:hypothetical protein
MKQLFILVLTLPLIAAGSLPGTFAHRFSSGESIRYKYTYDITAAGARDRFGGEFRLSVKSVDGVIAGTEYRTQTAPAKSGSRDFQIAQDGSLTFAGSASPSHNYVTYDPRQYCPPPANLTVGASWNCSVPNLGYFHGGAAHIRVTAMDDKGITLETSGSGADAPKSEHDPENGRTYISHSTTSWRETVRFADGLVASIAREQVTRSIVQNLTLDARMKATIERI